MACQPAVEGRSLNGRPPHEYVCNDAARIQTQQGRDRATAPGARARFRCADSAAPIPDEFVAGSGLDAIAEGLWVPETRPWPLTWENASR